MDSRGAAWDRAARRQLLGERGSPRSAAVIPDQRLPAGDRCDDGKVDPQLRQGRPCRFARGRRPRSGTLSAACSRTPGRIYKNLILLGSAPGEAYLSAPGTLRAYDVVTGALVWAFHTVPHPGEEGYETWPKDAWKYIGGANTWGEISVDAARGIAYFPTGSATYDYYGADRLGSNLYSNSLIALDANTGKRRWHFQVVHHDLWDYDLTAAPQLVTVRHGGRTIDAVAQATKQGFLFVFDRVTGRRCGRSRSGRFRRARCRRSDLADAAVSDQAGAICAAVDDGSRPDTVLPDSRRARAMDRAPAAREAWPLRAALDWYETVAVPGANGGANWGNTAADPRAGLVYVISQDFPSFYRLSENPPGGGGGGDQPPRVFTRSPVRRVMAPTDRGQRPHADKLASRMEFVEFRELLVTGRGPMPPFGSLEDEACGRCGSSSPGRNRVASSPGRRPPPVADGPVVASGGAPGGLDRARGRQGGQRGAPYPEGVEAPKARYYTPYGLSFPYIMKGRWSQITAYDLNTGAIRWQAPLGVDRAPPRSVRAMSGSPAAGCGWG